MKEFFNANNYLPILNGLIGDKLALKKDSWSIPLSFRVDGRDVPVHELDPALRGRHTVVFVHGLMADERIWKKFGGLKKDYATLYVRYNTGLHIYENGKLLAQLLNSLQKELRVKSLHLMGHSMGGLVIRSACHYGKRNRHVWVEKVRSIFLIAVPNAGAALEKLGHMTTGALNRIARWHLGTIGNILEQRSDGIKDLRLGSMLEEDWINSKMKPASVIDRAPVPPLPGIEYHILVGNLSANEKSLMAKYFGDGLVTHSSAIAATLFKVATVKVFVRTGHNSILANPKVIRHVQTVLRGLCD